MKTKQELDALREEFHALRNKLAELTEEELEQVSGGVGIRKDDLSNINGLRKRDDGSLKIEES